MDIGQRTYTQHNVNGLVTTRPDPLFELKVRRVCRACNSGWMNHLDLHVENWIINPDDQNAYRSCDPALFRRWVIKWSIMRSLIDNPTVVPATDRHRLYKGDDLEEWQIFVGRAHFKEWRHAFAAHGAGFPARGGNPEHYIGFFHVSVALGTAVISATRFLGGLNPTTSFLPDFIKYNRLVGEPLVEIPHGANSLPDIFAHRKLAYGQTEPFFMFFTNAPVSPMAGEMQKAYDDLRLHIAALSGAYDLSRRQE